MYRAALLIITYAAVLLSLVHARASIPPGIDLFTRVPQTISAMNPGEVVMSSIDTDGSFIGLNRNLSAEVTQGSLGITCAIVNPGLNTVGSFSHSANVGVLGTCIANYGPFDAFDFTFLGANCWLVKILESDNRGRITICASSDGGAPLCSTFLIPVRIVRITPDSPGVDICIPFVGALSEYTAITNLEVTLEGEQANLDININYICFTPRVSCWHIIDTMGNEGLNVGNLIGVMVFCENYESLPSTTEVVDIRFDFPVTTGSIMTDSVICDPFSNAFIENNTFVVNDISLPEGERIGCSFLVSLTGGGSSGNLWADVNVQSSGLTLNSHNGANRVLLNEEFCNPPDPAVIFVQSSPSTSPPSTLPPTTIPPTNPPPTTLPPTTNAPTTNPPTVAPTTLQPTTLPPTTLSPTTPPPTAPPTTLSPTTLVPTTLPPTLTPATNAPTTNPPTLAPTSPPVPVRNKVCVSPKIMNGQCICETDICVKHPNNVDYQCGARGWYCFITATGRTIRVTYRGQECYCTI
mmetsp:Transcript_14120/g.15617  ORF Transcript_14120/g.15617 Transcript_14120/m.15617 type:complete len:522 (-) Transcript_14120:444-2009(-)